MARKLFDAIAPRFAERPGGYTRLLRVGRRQSDDAALAQVELVGSEYTPTDGASGAEEAAVPAKAEGVGGRIRRAAKRITGGERAEEPSAPADEAAGSAEEAGPALAEEERGIGAGHRPTQMFSPPADSPRSAFASAMILACRWVGTSS